MTNAGKSSRDGYVMSTWLLLGLSSCYCAIQSVGFLGVAFFEDIPRAFSVRLFELQFTRRRGIVFFFFPPLGSKKARSTLYKQLSKHEWEDPIHALTMCFTRQQSRRLVSRVSPRPLCICAFAVLPVIEGQYGSTCARGRGAHAQGETALSAPAMDLIVNCSGASMRSAEHDVLSISPKSTDKSWS
jgi:hypothetical protein